MSKQLSKGAVLVIAVAVVAAVVWAGLGFPPSSEEGPGTIMQAERHQAESAPAGTAASEDDEVATEGLSAEQLAEPDAGQDDADRAQATEAAKALNSGKVLI